MFAACLCGVHIPWVLPRANSLFWWMPSACGAQGCMGNLLLGLWDIWCHFYKWPIEHSSNIVPFQICWLFWKFFSNIGVFLSIRFNLTTTVYNMHFPKMKFKYTILKKQQGYIFRTSNGIVHTVVFHSLNHILSAMFCEDLHIFEYSINCAWNSTFIMSEP